MKTPRLALKVYDGSPVLELSRSGELVFFSRLYLEKGKTKLARSTKELQVEAFEALPEASFVVQGQ